MTSLIASRTGPWRIDSITKICGTTLPDAARVDVVESPAGPLDTSGDASAAWVLRGVDSNLRYTTQEEAATLAARQPGLGRPEASCAALIPMRKNAAWWALAQDRRRALLEEQSHHITIGLEYLPAVSRRLLHSRDLGEPFDFLTWFEFAPEHTATFDEMLRRLRSSEEWTYVDREVDIRLTRDTGL